MLLKQSSVAGCNGGLKRKGPERVERFRACYWLNRVRGRRLSAHERWRRSS